jgi:hypothetical protein
MNQDVIIKIHDYKEDARKSKISINNKRIKIEKVHTFYLKYYILIFISMVFSGIMSRIMESFLLVLGSVIVALPSLLMMLYEVYVKEDRIIVEKNPKTTKKEKKFEGEKKVDIVD